MGTLVKLPDLSTVAGIQSVPKAQQFLHGVSTYLMQSSVSLSGFSIAIACVKEISQEIFIDPLVETFVSNLVREMGYDATIQMIASTLAESIREEFSGQISGMFGGGQSGFTFQDYMDKRLTVEHQYPIGLELVQYFNQYKTGLSASQDNKFDLRILGVLGTSLKMFTLAISSYSINNLENSMRLSNSLKWSAIGARVLVSGATIGFLSAFYGLTGLVTGLGVVSLASFGMVTQPKYFQDETFLRILREISDYMITNKEGIIQDVEAMSESEALQYIRRSVSFYLFNEKQDLMNKFLQEDKPRKNKLTPKVDIYASVVYLLQFTDQLVNQIFKTVTGVKHPYVKFVRDYLGLTTPERFTYTIKNIEVMLSKMGYELVEPLTQAKFNELGGDAALRTVTIRCPNGHEYPVSASHIKNGMLKNGKRCRACDSKSRIKYDWNTILQEVEKRGDKMLTTKEEFDKMEEAHSDRIIEIECSGCKKIRKVMVRTYFKYERCSNCYHLESSLNYEEVRKRGLDNNLLLITTKQEFNKLKSAYNLDVSKDWRIMKLEWKCLDCKELVKWSFQSVSDDRTKCPSCRMSKHQKHIQKYLEATYGVPCEAEKRLGDINLARLGINPSGFSFNPNLVFDGYFLVKIPGNPKAIPVLFEARGYQYYRWPNHYHEGTIEGYNRFIKYRQNANQKDRYAHEHKIILLSFRDDWTPTEIRNELISQFKLKTRIYGYSKNGITLNPPNFDKFIFMRRFLGAI